MFSGGLQFSFKLSPCLELDSETSIVGIPRYIAEMSINPFWRKVISFESSSYFSKQFFKKNKLYEIIVFTHWAPGNKGQ